MSGDFLKVECTPKHDQWMSSFEEVDSEWILIRMKQRVGESELWVVVEDEMRLERMESNQEETLLRHETASIGSIAQTVVVVVSAGAVPLQNWLVLEASDSLTGNYTVDQFLDGILLSIQTLLDLSIQTLLDLSIQTLLDLSIQTLLDLSIQTLLEDWLHSLLSTQLPTFLSHLLLVLQQHSPLELCPAQLSYNDLWAGQLSYHDLWAGSQCLRWHWSCLTRENVEQICLQELDSEIESRKLPSSRLWSQRKFSSSCAIDWTESHGYLSFSVLTVDNQSYLDHNEDQVSSNSPCLDHHNFEEFSRSICWGWDCVEPSFANLKLFGYKSSTSRLQEFDFTL